jgi:hypothetical protein
MEKDVLSLLSNLFRRSRQVIGKADIVEEKNRYTGKNINSIAYLREWPSSESPLKAATLPAEIDCMTNWRRITLASAALTAAGAFVVFCFPV